MANIVLYSMKGPLPVFFNNPVSLFAIAVFPQYGTKDSIYGTIQFNVNSNGSISTNVNLKGFDLKNAPYSLHIHEATIDSDEYCFDRTGKIQAYRKASHYHRDNGPDYDYLLEKNNGYKTTTDVDKLLSDQAEPNSQSDKEKQFVIQDKALFDILQTIDYTMIGNLSAKYGLIKTKNVQFKRNDPTLSLQSGSGAYIGESSVIVKDAMGKTTMCSNIHFNYEGLVEQQLVRELSHTTLAGKDGYILFYLSLSVWLVVIIALIYSLMTTPESTDDTEKSSKVYSRNKGKC